MISGKTIVFLPTVAWNRNWQRQQEWASRLAEHNKVIYVAPYGMTSMGPLTVLKKLRRDKGFAYKHVVSKSARANILHTRLIFIPIRNTRVLTWLNARWMQRQLTTLGVSDSNDTVFWICNPADTSVALLERYRNVVSIYDVAMRFTLLPDAPPWLARSQNQLARRVDSILCDSHAVMDDLPADTLYKTNYVPQGFNQSTQDKTIDEHPEVRDIPHPRAVYIGLDTVLDLAPLKACLNAIPSLNIIMIGPLDPTLLAHPRVHWVGPVNVDQKDAYMIGSDVGLIPYTVNAYTAGTFPTKFFEYLALGIPVVSTDLAELRLFEPHVRLAKTSADFVAHVRSAIQSKPARPDDFLQNHSWQRRYQRVQSILMRLL